MPAVFPQTKETTLHQVKVREKLAETNKLAMDTNQTVAKISGFASLDKGTPKQKMEMEPIGHMVGEFDGEWNTWIIVLYLQLYL